MSSDPIVQQTEEQKFLELFPGIVSVILADQQFTNAPEIKARVKELLEYNSLGGDKTRGLMTVYSYQMLEKPENITEESMRRARILGWCLELFQTSLVILDDLADKSLTRRGQPCWYRRPDVGVLAVNDSLLLLTIVFDLLRNTIGEVACYPEILNVFNKALSQLCIGQYPTLSHSNDFSRFTMDNFKSYSHHKRTYYTFNLPVYISLLLAGRSYKNAFDNSEDILIDMGVLISKQNDYLDCYGDEALTGKAGNDIVQGKCTWLAVTALQRCSANQRTVFIDNYGSASSERVQRIKRLYDDLRMQELFQEAEKAGYQSVVSRIEALPADNAIPPALLLNLFEMVYHMKAD